MLSLKGERGRVIRIGVEREERWPFDGQKKKKKTPQKTFLSGYMAC